MNVGSLTAESVGVVPLGQHHGGDRRGIILRIPTHDFQTPRAHRAPRRLAVPDMPREHAVEPFLVQHVDRFGQTP